MIIDDVDLIYENYKMINSKFIPTVTNPELFKEICDTKNAEEIAELIKNGQMPAYQDVNEVVKVWTSGWFYPSVMTANSIKSIEDAKKLDKDKIQARVCFYCFTCFISRLMQLKKKKLQEE